MDRIFAHLDNPFLPFGLSVLTFTFTAGFTPPTSYLRVLGLVIMVYSSWIMYANLQTYSFDRPFYKNFLGGSACSIVLKYIEWVLLSRWSFEAQGPTSSASGISPIRAQPRGAKGRSGHGSGGYWERRRFGVTCCWDERLTGTPWQVKGVPTFDAARPARKPTRRQFYMSTLAAILIYGLILDIMGLNADSSDNAKNFSYLKVPFFERLGEISGEEVAIRVLGTVIWWPASFWMLQVVYNVAALVLVATGFSRPERWAPMFGRVSELWSIRQFWGTFWQQCMRRKLEGISHFILHTVLRVPKGGLFARYIFLVLVFFLSGVVHMVADIFNAIPLQETGALRFYMTQAFGIMVEDFVRYLYRTYRGYKRDGKPPTLAERLPGYIWLFFWLVWTTPSWAWPSMARAPEGSPLPFSPLEFALK